MAITKSKRNKVSSFLLLAIGKHLFAPQIL